MFGLMKSRNCRANSKLRKLYRLHYCGTCKTLGRLYGQKTRFLLNYDVVFLGEILSSISNHNQLFKEFDKSPCLSFKWFDSPKYKNEMPLSLQFAATVNLIWSKIKIDDNINDSGSYIWKLLSNFYSTNVRKAIIQMEKWKFPIKELWRWSHIQKLRENNIEKLKYKLTINEIINYLSEPTAVTTGLIFMHGAKLMQKESLQHLMYDLGFVFGKLVYLLDAFEDFDSDHKKNNFNAWRVAYNISDATLSKKFKNKIIQSLSKLQVQVENDIFLLSIPKKQSEYFVDRLRTNFYHKLNNQLCSLHSSCNSLTKVEFTIKDKWENAREFGKSMMGYSCSAERYSKIVILKKSIISIAYTLFALLLPTSLYPFSIQPGGDSDECCCITPLKNIDCEHPNLGDCCCIVCYGIVACRILFYIRVIIDQCCCYSYNYGNDDDQSRWNYNKI